MTLSVVCLAQPLTKRFVVELEQKAGSPGQNVFITPDHHTLSYTLSDIAHTKGYAGSDLSSDQKQGKLNGCELKTTILESIWWPWLYANYLLVGYELIQNAKNTPLSSTSYSWLPPEMVVAVGWLFKNYWNINLPSFNLIAQKELCQNQPLAAIITIPGSGNARQQCPPPESSGQQTPEATARPTGSSNSFFYSDFAGGSGGSQQHRHTLGLDCFVFPCHGVCQFRPSSDSRGPTDTDVTPESDPCPICLVHFHGRDESLVVVKAQCCGKHFDLDCISKCFVEQPIGSRHCVMCRQDPMPMVNVNTGESHPDTFFPDQAFYRACFYGDLDQVEKSLAEEVNVNTVINDGLTALMMASSQGHKNIVERLINAGANISAACSTGGNALFFAAQNNKPECVKLLIKAKADLNANCRDGVTPLFIAAQQNCTDCLKILINTGADLNASRTSDGATALLIAAWLDNTECVKLLIEAKADLNARTKDGFTALSIAADMGNIDCVTALVEAKADVNAALSDGSTPLLIAAKRGSIDCVKILINAGADLNARTHNGFIPLLIAANMGHTDIVTALVKARAR
ncbi:ankyrin repeat domain-containing protein [Endozoicomonas sp. ISHI1]|uniref:ankyrin repeat domain-containing protein n=3 Tax=unclassified Endozoicomonas TaxID=2644528 RepID=UPI0021494FB8|nr:ankyrin repeat domain-containing protein [Endozoicomonas sp. ISHI1]